MKREISISIKRYLIIFLLASITFLVSRQLRVHFENAQEPILKSFPTHVEFEKLDQNKVTSEEILKDQSVLFVHFWGTWCAPCEAELPDIIKLMSKLKNSKLKFLLIASNDDKKNVLKFMNKFNFPKEAQVLLDPKGEIMKRFGTVKVPETYLFNIDGKILKKFVGPQRWLDFNSTDF